jgi:hypothetical protein
MFERLDLLIQKLNIRSGATTFSRYFLLFSCSERLMDYISKLVQTVHKVFGRNVHGEIKRLRNWEAAEIQNEEERENRLTGMFRSLL